MAIRDSVDLSEDQQAQHDTLRAFLTDQLSSAELRARARGRARLPSRTARRASRPARPVRLDDPGGVRRARQVPGRGVRDPRRARPRPVPRSVPAQLGGGRGAAGDRPPRGLRALAAPAGRRHGGRDGGRRRRGRLLGPRPRRRPGRLRDRRLAAVRPPLVRGGGARRGHPRGPGGHRIRPGHVPGRNRLPEPGPIAPAGPGPDPPDQHRHLRGGSRPCCSPRTRARPWPGPSASS